MEIVKQYLEKRLDSINKMLDDKEEMYYATGVRGQATLQTVKVELQQVLKLINDEKESFIKMYGD